MRPDNSVPQPIREDFVAAADCRAQKTMGPRLNASIIAVVAGKRLMRKSLKALDCADDSVARQQFWLIPSPGKTKPCQYRQADTIWLNFCA